MWLAWIVLAQAAIADPKRVPDPTPFLLITKPSLPRGAVAAHAVAPMFPAELQAHTQVTTVLVDVVVDRQGRVRRAVVAEPGDEVAHRAAMRAAVQWIFEPAEQGKVDRTLRLSFTFRTLPAWAPPDEVTTVFRNKYDVEVRAIVAPKEP